VTLDAVALLNAPQVLAMQGTLFAIKVHVTPLFNVSCATVALNVTAAAPATMVVILLVMVTTIGCAVTVNGSESDFVLSTLEVAVMVTVGGVGGSCGGVYITERAVAFESDPHDDVQAAIAHVTPWAFWSFVTVAFRVTALVAACMVVILFVMLTEIGGVIVSVTEPLLEPSAADVAVTVTVKFAATTAGAV
jgi:hypothetical protein